MLRRLYVLVALIPVAVVTAVSGAVSSPSRSPCVTSYSKGFTGAPNHVTLGPDGNLWATEGQNDLIAKFDIRLKRVTAEYRVPKGSQLHDLVTGPDGNLWFSGQKDRLGRLDIKTGKVTVFPGLKGAGNPHIWWAPDGYAYISEVDAGRLARFDPKTGKITSSRYNLPPNSGIHSFADLPNGDTWWALGNKNELALFDIHRHTFVRFVHLTGGRGPHWLAYVPGDHAVWIAFEFSNNLGRFDLRTGKVTYLGTPLKPADPSLFKSFTPFPYLTQMFPDAQSRYLWVATLAGGEVLRVDLRTHAVKKVYCGLGPPGITIVLTRDRSGHMWVTEPFNLALGRISS
jgi:hypothetical protein